MLKLKLQYFGYLKQRADSLEKTLMLGKIEGRRRSGEKRTRWSDGITESMSISLGKLQKLVSFVSYNPWGCKEPGTTEWLKKKQYLLHVFKYSYGVLEKAMAPTPVLLPGKSHGQRSLVGYSSWGLEESVTTE